MSLDGRTIGLVEDDPIMGESLVQSLSLEGAVVEWWKTGEEALRNVGAIRPDLLVCDMRLPDMSGEQVFRRVANLSRVPPVLFVTAYADIDQAVSLLRAGAGDYMTKPFEMREFMKRADSLLHEGGQCVEGVLGVSPQMRQIEATLARLAKPTSTVLVTGETGTGKEVCARRLHSLSGAAGEPFVAVNCAAIPAELIESELFGHDRGAFTGATAQHAGYAERARRGVLFLDEIGDMPMALQGKLLRLISERTFQRVGGEKQRSFEARIVCATNCDLAVKVRDGLFREDLYYRINVVALEIPPLRDRPDDIPWLLEHFVVEQCENQGSALRGMSSLVEELAMTHDWPGNVRELRNRVERGVALALGEVLMPGDLFPELEGSGAGAGDPLASLAMVREAAERRQILRALSHTGGHIIEAAQLLGISRTTMWDKMRRYGIDDAAR